jgi:hypothetical protein
MTTSPKQIGLVLDAADMPTGGAVSVPTDNAIEQYRAVTLKQTTADQTITLPDPVDEAVVFGLLVCNTGTASFTIYGLTITAKQNATIVWDGEEWGVDVGPGSSSPVKVSQPVTAQNVITDLATKPKAGSPVRIYLNGILDDTGGVTVDADGKFTVTPATLGMNLQTYDKVTCVYET